MTGSNISKANVNPYYGREIPKWQELGLDPDSIYRLYRDPVELERGMATFSGKPILGKHKPTTAAKPNKDLVIGSIGTDISFEAPYLRAPLTFWDAEAIADIQANAITELSCGYYYDALMEPGDIDGESFDGRMVNIVGNHLALVENGRAGDDVVVADSNPFAKKGITRMKMTALGRALFAGLRSASPKLAMDAALPALVAKQREKTLDRAALKLAVMALDADLEGETVDGILDAILGVESEPEPVEPAAPAATPTPPVAKDADPAAMGKKEKLSAHLKGKLSDEDLATALGIACDDDTEGDIGEVQGAMDAAIKTERASLLEQFRALDVAKSEVRETVGEVIGMDSAADVYAFALKQLGVEHAGVSDPKALRTLFSVASTRTAKQTTPVMAHDSANTLKRFPGVARFGRA